MDNVKKEGRWAKKRRLRREKKERDKKSKKLHYYLGFNYALGYGRFLPVIVEVSKEVQDKLKKAFQEKYSDDDYVSFDMDDSYVSINSIIDSSCFFEMDIEIPFVFCNLESEKILSVLNAYFDKR